MRCAKYHKRVQENHDRYWTEHAIPPAEKNAWTKRFHAWMAMSWVDFTTHVDPKEQEAVLEWMGIRAFSPEEQRAFWEETDPEVRATMFCKQNTSYLRHQQYLASYFLQHPSLRYCILYHEMGSGKTCTSTALMESFTKVPDIRDVYVVVPNSLLVSQFANDFLHTCSFVPRILSRKMRTEQAGQNTFTFAYENTRFHILTYCGYMQLRVPDPGRSVLIIDEAHNLRSAAKIASIGAKWAHTSRTAPRSAAPAASDSICLRGEGLYTKMVVSNKGFRHVFCMTGTPVINSGADFITLLNCMLLLTGQENQMMNTVTDADLIGAINQQANFISPRLQGLQARIGHILHTTRGFLSRIRVTDMGHNKMPTVDFSQHYYDYSADFRGSFPHTQNIVRSVGRRFRMGLSAKPVEVPMTLQQYEQVMGLQSMKGRSVRGGGEESDRMFATDFDRQYNKISWATGKIHPARLLCNTPQKLQEILQRMVVEYTEHPSPILIHTTLIETTKDLCRLLEAHTYVPYTHPTSGRPTYAVITGTTSVSEMRTILHTYNHPNNVHGKDIMVCVISAAAGTGVTFRNTRQVHIVEPSWSFSYLQQVTGRAVRNNVFVEPNAHVKVFGYLSVSPSSSHPRKTPDQEIYDLMLHKMQYVEAFNVMLHALAIEQNMPRETGTQRTSILPTPMEITFANTKKRMRRAHGTPNTTNTHARKHKHLPLADAPKQTPVPDKDSLKTSRSSVNSYMSARSDVTSNKTSSAHVSSKRTRR